MTRRLRPSHAMRIAVAAAIIGAVCLNGGLAAGAHGSTHLGSRSGERVIVGRGVAGVVLGETGSAVRARLGTPSRQQPPYWSYPNLDTRVQLDYWGRVQDIETTWAQARTGRGVGPGASLSRFRRAYPHARCYRASVATARRICVMRSRYEGRVVESDFLFTSRLRMIDMYAVGQLPTPTGMH
jgi:hypothetical protein